MLAFRLRCSVQKFPSAARCWQSPGYQPGPAGIQPALGLALRHAIFRLALHEEAVAKVVACVRSCIALYGTRLINASLLRMPASSVMLLVVMAGNV